MKVIARNEVKETTYPKRIICDHCGAELEYHMDDEYSGRWGMRCVTCPVCNEEVFVSDHRIEPPNWRESFDHISTENAVSLSDSEIQKYVDKCYEHLMSDTAKPGDFYTTGSGDTMIFGFRDEDTVELYVARGYYVDVTCL